MLGPGGSLGSAGGPGRPTAVPMEAAATDAVAADERQESDVDAIERSRRDYAVGELDDADLDPDPLAQLRRWIDEAAAAGIDEPNAMVLATADAEGRPDARVVLLRGLDHGLVWFTHRTSAKGRQLAARPVGAVVLHWQPLERQVRVRGPVAPVDDDASDAYFASRPRASQLGAWASDQSAPIGARVDLEARLAETARRFGDGPVPRPPTWGGYRLVPDEVEVWQGRRSRLHDRVRYRRAGDAWVRERLQP